MIYSYIGLAEPVVSLNRALKSAINTHRSNNNLTSTPLKWGGVFGSDVSRCANFAAKNDMAIYLTADDVVKKSDLLFVFLSRKSLGNLAKSFRNHGIRNKIFCHFNQAFDASVLDFGEDNTYISFYVPFWRKRRNDWSGMPVFVEGYGPRYREVCTLMRILNIPYTEVNAEEKLAVLSAVNILGDYKMQLEQCVQKLLKISLHGKRDIAGEIFEKSMSDEYTLNCYNPVSAPDIQFIENQSELLASVGMKDVSSVFASHLISQVYNANLPAEFASKAKSIATKLITK